MHSLQLKAIMAGIFFGSWPIFMNRSGLGGNVSSVCFAGAAVIGLLPFALHNNGFTIPQANWTMVGISGILGTFGLLCFNGMLAKASAQDIGSLIIITTLMQVVVAASYQVYMNGQIPLDKICGYALATAGAYLLLR